MTENVQEVVDNLRIHQNLNASLSRMGGNRIKSTITKER